MEDRFYYESILTTAKNLCDIFLHATIEATNPHVKQTFQNCLNHTLEWQHLIYKKMESLGYYQNENVEKYELEKEMNKIQPLYQNCCCNHTRA